MKSITILSLSLFEIAITASLSLLSSASSSSLPSLPIPPFFPLFHRLPPHRPFPHLLPSMTLSPLSPLFYLISPPLHLLLCTCVLYLSLNLYFTLTLLFYSTFISHSLSFKLCSSLSSPVHFLRRHLFFSRSLLYDFSFLIQYLPLSPNLSFTCFPLLSLFILKVSASFSSALPSNAPLLLFLSSAHSAHPGWCDHRSHHRGGAGPAGAHCGHLLPDEVPGGAPRLQPQCQVSDRPVAGGALPVGSVPGTGAEAGAHPWHRHLRGQAGIAAVPCFDLVRCGSFRFEVSRLERGR